MRHEHSCDVFCYADLTNFTKCKMYNDNFYLQHSGLCKCHGSLQNFKKNRAGLKRFNYVCICLHMFIIKCSHMFIIKCSHMFIIKCSQMSVKYIKLTE